jgi:DNA-binding transcriptional MerR regulator
MKKAPDAFRTISEVSELLDTPAHVLRFWESKFYQVRPVKRAGGRRYYRPDDLALIAGIKHLLQDRGMTIRGVQKIMQEEGVRHVIGLGRKSGRLEEEVPTESADEPTDDAAQVAVEVPPLIEAAPAPADAAETGASAEASPQPVQHPEPPQISLPLPDTAAPSLLDGQRLVQMLRRIPPERAQAAALGPIALRLDRLLDRMAASSGTRRW